MDGQDLEVSLEGTQQEQPSEEVTEHADGTLEDNVRADDGAGEPPAAEGEAPAADAPPPYAPNYKFKVYDQEHEIDEMYRGLMKDAETEKKVRELHEKAFGIDGVKTKLQESRQQATEYKGQLESFMQEVEGLKSLRDSDLDSFFEAVQLPPQKVAQWLLDKLQRQQLPPEQQTVYNQLDEARREVRALKQQTSSLSRSSVDSVTQARITELNGILSSPDISPLVEQFDTRMGQSGSFAELVKKHAAAEWQMSRGKVDLSPQQAVDAVMKVLGLSPQAPSQGSQPRETAAPQPKVVTAKKPTVIPNVGSSSASPTSQRPKSIEDLKKLAAGKSL